MGRSGRRLPHFLRGERWLPPTLVVVAVLAVYEGVTRADTSLLPRENFVPPTEIAEAFWAQVQTSSFWSALLATIQGWAGGLGAATLVAVPIGMLIGAVPWLWRSLRLLIEVLRPLPAIAVLPLLLLLLGSGLDLRIVFVMIAAFWPLLIQAMYGVQNIDATARDMARVYRLGSADRVRFIVLPSALPYLTTGMRLAAVFALGGAVAVELIVGGDDGVGASIAFAQVYGQNDVMFAYVFTAGLLGLLINVLFRAVERRVLVWHASERKVAAA